MTTNCGKNPVDGGGGGRGGPGLGPGPGPGETDAEDEDAEDDEKDPNEEKAGVRLGIGPGFATGVDQVGAEAEAVTGAGPGTEPVVVPTEVVPGVDQGDGGQRIHGSRFSRSVSLFSSRAIVRRNSSEKKIVRFADSLGLDLESVRFIQDGCHDVSLVPGPTRQPRHPEWAPDPMNSSPPSLLPARPPLNFRFRFEQPVADSVLFMQRLFHDRVILENCSAGACVIGGTIRVVNLDPMKEVTVRYTINNWLTFDDLGTTYMLTPGDRRTNRFTFLVRLPDYFSAGFRIDFAIRYATRLGEFWDNNYGNNYVVDAV